MSDPFPTAEAQLTPPGYARWRHGHPWTYRDGVEVVRENTGEEPIARVVDPRGRVVGHALLSRSSQILLRRLTRSEAPIDRAFLKARVEQAAAYRERVAEGRDAMRLVFGESDGLPGLVVDRYGNHVVLQELSWAMNALQDPILSVVEEVLAPQSILARNDLAVRALEGLPRQVEQVKGKTPERIPYHEGELEFLADPHHGQKTGAFLDQVENHLLVGRIAFGRVLDAFTYGGGFALAAAQSADEVVAVDSSGSALQLAQQNAKRNAVENVSFVNSNVFDFLKHADRQGEEFDTVILDPPAFAKNKRELDGAVRGYKEINLRAMKLLRPGGILVTCSCSYHLGEALLDEVLTRAAADTFRSFRVLERRRQAADHPVLLGFPESLYLKCQVLQRLA
jgi:23S rRNA (cytosine1962-C5)-methyltransferase